MTLASLRVRILEPPYQLRDPLALFITSDEYAPEVIAWQATPRAMRVDREPPGIRDATSRR